MVEGEHHQRATADALLLLAATTKRKSKSKQPTTDENRGEMTKKPKRHHECTTTLTTSTKPSTRAMTAVAEVRKKNASKKKVDTLKMEKAPNQSLRVCLHQVARSMLVSDKVAKQE